ncbi:MAG: hypothetical protein JW973_16340 [Bacteroidales bacterium]|nr:hypothetical protein [Bacteroidales bacterium]
MSKKKLSYRTSGKKKLFLLLVLSLHIIVLSGQDASLQPKTIAFFDSLDNRITVLQNQIPRLKQTHDISFFHIQRELDHSLFIKAYEQYVVDEDLFRAKDLVESRLERARLRKDKFSIDFYNSYKDKVYTQIKFQRMHYQELFEKEKNFRKEFFSITKDETIEAYQRALRMTDLALKYAEENNLTETAKGLNNYRRYAEARIFDLQSSYDLNEITKSQKDFEKVFIPLIESDSIRSVKEAEKLIDYCIQYSHFVNTPLTDEYLDQQKLAIASALSDLLDKQGSSSNLSSLTSQAVRGRLDSLNPRGVYKWHEYVIVISEFTPSSGFENVRKGEAIINADNVIASYLKKNKLCKSTDNLKFGYAYIIPYKSSNKSSSFLYHPGLQKWQYIACYTLINSPGFTREVSRYMPPIVFKEEDQLMAEP